MAREEDARAEPTTAPGTAVPTYTANVIHRPGLAGLLVQIVPATIFLLLGVATALLGHAEGVVSPLFLAGLSLVVGRGVRSKWTQRASEAAPTTEVIVDREHLVLRRGAESRTLVRSHLRTGHVVPTERGAHVILRGRWGVRADLWLSDLQEARALLADLGLSPLERPMTFTFFFNLHVTVGIDGVLIRVPLLGRKHFLPHRRIEEIRWTDDLVRILLPNGESYEVSTATRASTAENREAHLALVERLVVAREQYRKAESSEPIAVLARAGRSVEAWVRDLRAMTSAQNGAGYRSAALPKEMLWRIALDPAERADLRIGASVALRDDLDREGREKLRLAANASASPRVRIALAATADEENDDALIATLDSRAG